MACLSAFAASFMATAQTAPSAREIANYRGLHAAVARGDIAAVSRLVHQRRANINARDPYGRTPLMVAGYKRNIPIATALMSMQKTPKPMTL